MKKIGFWILSKEVAKKYKAGDRFREADVPWTGGYNPHGQAPYLKLTPKRIQLAKDTKGLLVWVEHEGMFGYPIKVVKIERPK